MTFEHAVEWIAKAVDAIGVGAMVIGIAVASVVALRRSDSDRYIVYRRQIGRAILLGLEFLVAADIIRTVAVAPTWRGVGVLAVIVAIRTFLSFTLEVELHGRWPWQRAREA